MSDKPVSLTSPSAGYADWLTDLKGRTPRSSTPISGRGRMPEFVQQAAAQLPWYHQLALLDNEPI